MRVGRKNKMLMITRSQLEDGGGAQKTPRSQENSESVTILLSLRRKMGGDKRTHRRGK